MKIFLFILLIYLVIMNITAIIVTTIDKIRARRGQSHNRMPESLLLLLAFVGGAPLMYVTMLMIRHKTNKRKFMITLPVISMIWIAVVLTLLIKLTIWA